MEDSPEVTSMLARRRAGEAPEAGTRSELDEEVKGGREDEAQEEAPKDGSENLHYDEGKVEERMLRDNDGMGLGLVPANGLSTYPPETEVPDWTREPRPKRRRLEEFTNTVMRPWYSREHLQRTLTTQVDPANEDEAEARGQCAAFCLRVARLEQCFAKSGGIAMKQLTTGGMALTLYQTLRLADERPSP